ncbi:MAG: hypothetical protein Q7J38_09260, partial [Gallionella sp.]|nr:hypothetical protein [Gallionella sp.]
LPNIALPRLACGMTGLDWNEVKPLIEKQVGDLGISGVCLYQLPKRHQSQRTLKIIKQFQRKAASCQTNSITSV